MALPARLLRPMASGSGFEPRRIAGLVGWWDAADANSVTLDGGRVATWADKSGLGRNATNSTSGSTQPAYITAAVSGRNAIRFVANNNTQLILPDITIPASHTVLGVFTRPTASKESFLLGTKVGPNVRFSFRWGNENLADQRSNASITTHGTSSTATGSFAVTVRRTETTSVLVRRNGTVLGNSTTGNGVTNVASGEWSSFGIVSNGGPPIPPYYMDGDACETILYSRNLADGEIAKIEDYLARKWGVNLA